jgi:predicted nucleic acid-binding protein
MNWLLDVNLILASRWTTHPDHSAAKAWINALDKFYTTAITELGFVRISLSAAYLATWDEAQETLKKLHARSGHQFLADDVDGRAAPETGSKDTTDAHLVTLAKRHGMKLATLDDGLIGKPWAAGIAENPLLSPKPSSTSG